MNFEHYTCRTSKWPSLDWPNITCLQYTEPKRVTLSRRQLDKCCKLSLAADYTKECEFPKSGHTFRLLSLISLLNFNLKIHIPVWVFCVFYVNIQLILDYLLSYKIALKNRAWYIQQLFSLLCKDVELPKPTLKYWTNKPCCYSSLTGKLSQTNF